MICPICQSENKEGAKFCNECGFPLTGRIATVAAAAASDDAARAAADAEAAAVWDEDAPNEAAKSDGGDQGSASEDVPNDAADGLGKDAPAADNAQSDSAAKNDGASVPAEGAPVARRTLNVPAVRIGQGSGPLDPASLPVIGVAGVDVDEDGNEFDFSDVDERDAADDDDVREQRAEENRATPSVSAAVTADLSGLDECLVDASYAPPAASWRSGDTMEMPRVEGAPTPKQKEFRAPDPHQKKPGRVRVVCGVLAVLIVAAAAAVGITYQMELWGGKQVPDVSGMTQADATYQLEGKGFMVRAEQVKSDETEGLVLLMDPGAGSRAEEGTEVVIQVAVPRTIPDVVGKTQDEAAKLFADAGFDKVTFAEEKSDTAKGTVLSVSPEVGDKAKAATPITVTVAVPYTVPDVANLTSDEAVAALEAASYVANVAHYYTEDVAEGTVVGTDPAAGTELTSGSSVTVNVAISRASVLVPAAKNYLASVGTITLGGTSYEIVSVDAVSYTDYNQTSFTITATAVTTLDGEVVRGSAKQRSGTITWNDADEIVSIS